ncbi:MAG: hypothetical protein IT459_16840 [Planctomycetes bacterium]|nr:hypothetical protein [Planctomycetota bacterium]
MVLTDGSHLFASIDESGIASVLKHLRRQRPSLFHYATSAFRGHEELFCEPIDVDPEVLDAENPLFTEMDPIPVIGTPAEHPIGLNWCLQFSKLELDFHPNDVIGLPAELRPLRPQRFALRLRTCLAIDCPSEDFFAKELQAIERVVTRGRDLASRFEDLKPGATGKDTKGRAEKEPDRTPGRTPPVVPQLGKKLRCFCLDTYVVAHFVWAPIDDPRRKWLKIALDGFEFVDIGPEPLESTLECYIKAVLRLGIFPRLSQSIEAMVLDVTKVMRRHAIELDQRVRLVPTAAPADVPDNPAVEHDELRVFVDVVVEDF